MAIRYPHISQFEIISEEEVLEYKNLFYLIPSMHSPSIVKLQVQSKKNPQIYGELEIPITYNASQSYSYRGGSIGMQSSQTDPVNVYIRKIIRNGADLLWVKTQSGTKTNQTIINPAYTSVQIDCRGVNGYNGSDGSDGSDGGNDPPTDGGDGSPGGDGGNGGNGGAVFIYTDETSEPYLHALVIANCGGSGGSGGSGGKGGEGGEGKCDGHDGYDGSSGTKGIDGPPPEIIYIPTASLRAMAKF